MLPSHYLLREQLRMILANKEEQGHVVDGLAAELDKLPDSYDRLMDFANKISALPFREDWHYHEPNDLDAIRAECHSAALHTAIYPVDMEVVSKRVESAFLGAVCGCILGKPVEIDPTLDQLKTALVELGDWPLNNYISERLLPVLGKFHPSWRETVRERIQFVAPDDDINYKILGMLILEEYGSSFTKFDIRDMWLKHLPIGITFGPERRILLKAGINSLKGGDKKNLEEWVNVLNPREEWCGALIRADAYGYACPGYPALAAEMAWRDASWSHRRTGIYSTMFIAAAIANAFVMDGWLDIFENALKFVPRRSRFYRIVADSITEIDAARDWLDGYRRIHYKYEEYSHCRVFQEVGTLINTLKFAENVGDGICKQVCQGNDTDSFGATAGSLLGAYFGPGYLEERWLEPFHDEIRTALAYFYEGSLFKLAQRMGRLPSLVRGNMTDNLREDTINEE